MKYTIATLKKWNIDNACELQKNRPNNDIQIITSKGELTSGRLGGSEYVFFPHWSYLIPEDIFARFNCIVFHMTDLPYGRGGSPLQNLIARGHSSTKISAIRVTGELDGGDVYMKRELSLYGGAEEIYMRASKLVFADMIPFILDNRPEPVPQTGSAVVFERRKPTDSELSTEMSIERIFDHIRMLDADGYPPAYVRFGGYVMEFARPKLTSGGIAADVKIRRADYD